MLPKGWTVIKLSEYVNKIGSGVTPTGGSNTYKSKGIPLIRSQNVLWGKLELSDVAYIDNTQHQKMKSSKVTNGDVLLNITGASIGRAALVFDIDEANVNQHVCIIRTKNELAPAFLKDFLLSFGGQKQIEQFQSGGNRQGLNFEQIGSFKINLPPLPEQIKIAEILSTWDNSINTVQKLLANSQQQKKSLMQQLLTGKKRFSEFEGEWEEKRLGDVCSPQQWPTISSKDLVSNGYSVYGANGFIGYYFEYNHKNETVAVTCRGSTCGEVSLIPEKSYVTGNSMCLDDVNEKRYAYRYLYYFLKNRGFNDVISGSAQPQIVGSAIRKVKVLIPSLPEQQKIATILTTADQEIDNLRAQLNHLKQEKKALMQQLLTGKRRVKIEEAA